MKLERYLTGLEALIRDGRELKTGRELPDQQAQKVVLQKLFDAWLGVGFDARTPAER